ncbi:MAG: peptide deformylase [Gammaproteobacteria bacterium]|nr:peptide deformylase [Gammaproteobacteria bacterium]MCY4218851.1 peptide deformylase [Gammaproteobacteria bacterium]MCY4274675.1 peptide deformylase [Gammaproteobacteria bacterium]
MAVQKILTYPDPRLRTLCEPVLEFDKNLETLIEDMADTMYDAPGIGLAAIQINVPKRVIVMDLSETKSQLQVFVNPEIVDLNQGTREVEEGCLSVPGFFVPVKRPEKVLIKAQDKLGDHFELEADEMTAVCIQHEVDHLNGKVFVDYLSRMKRERIRNKLTKARGDFESRVA